MDYTEAYTIDEARLQDIEQFVSEHEEDFVRDIARLVAIESVEGPEEPDAPFGRGSKQALDCVLEIAAEHGLRTVNCENRIGYAEVGEDRGQGHLATITHVDVVPAGEGWTADPFVLREREGWLIGRGVMDDKGPSILCIYALKYLQERGIPLRYPVRALFGSNEETDMKDLDYYLEHYAPPLFCFSPDADFPLINGEKGIYHASMTSRHTPGNVMEITGGSVANAVAARALALVRAGHLESTDTVTAEQREDGLWLLSAVGISGHASMPAGTVNAIALLVDYILAQDICDEQELPFFRFLAKVHAATDGSGVGIQSEDGRFTALTLVGGTISTDDGRITQTVDVRYGTTMSGEKITDALQKAAGDAAEVRVDGDMVPFYMDPSNPAVQACIESYNLVTGEHAVPFTIGGGTYARHFPNAVAFGPEHPERQMPDFCGPIHGADEAAKRSYFTEALKIYIQALLRLEALDY